VEIMQEGGLRLHFETGYMTESAPVAWQEIGGQHVAVAVQFAQQAENRVGFSLGSYDPAHSVYIDPVYQWHTFYGSSNKDYGDGIAVDSSGNIYVTGSSLATWGTPLNAHAGGSDIVIVKLNSAGVYQWHTFYGGATGEYGDYGNGIAVDSSDNVYVTGYSADTWGSPLNSHDGNDGDIVVVKLNSAGVYQWHTFYGSTDVDYGYGIAVDSAGNVYVTGYSWANWGSPLNAHAGGSDIVIVKLSSAGTYQWHTFYGSSSTDVGGDIAVDSSGNIYATGWSSATWGSPLNAHADGDDIVVVKLNSAGTYQWHTFYGSSGYDIGRGIAVDSSDNVCVTGQSYATWGSPLNAPAGGGDIVIVKLDSAGVYQWHTFYGSSEYDYGDGIVVDSSGNVYVTGASEATWGSPLNSHAGYYDIVIVKLNSAGTYGWHTFYGSSYGDSGTDIAVDSSDNVYVTGSSADTWGSPLKAHAGDRDIVIIKFGDGILPPPISSFPWTETFESDSQTRAGWTQVQVSGSKTWIYATGSSGGSINAAYEGTLNARFTSSSTGGTTKLITPLLDLSTVSNPELSFWYGQEEWLGDQNELKVYYRTGPSASWVQIFHDNQNRSSWTNQTITLPNLTSTYQIAFEGIDNYGHANVLDNVKIQEMGNAPTRVGVHRDNTFYLDADGDLNFDAASDRYSNFGTPADTPVIGDWNGDGFDQIGIRRDNTFYLDYNDNMAWEYPGDIFGNFGIATDKILLGKWGP